MDNATPSIKRSATWATLGTSVQALSQLISLVVLARLLSPYEFGLISSASIINQFALLLCEFGIAAHLVQRKSLQPAFVASSQMAAYVLGISIAVTYLALAPWLATLFNSAELAAVMRAYSTLFLVFAITTIHDAMIQRALDFRFLALADAISFTLGYAVISILCALAGFSYWSLVLGHIAQAGIRSAIIHKRPTLIELRRSQWRYVRHQLHFGVGQSLSRLASLLAAQADSFIVASRLGVSSVGIYGRVNQLVTLPANQLGQVFDKVLFPYIARQQNVHASAGATYLAALRGICILSFAAAAFIWVFASNIVDLVLGSQWQAVIEPLRVLGLAIPFRLMHKVSDPTARAFGKTYSRAWRQWIVALTLTGLAYLLSNAGLVAIAYGVVATAILDACLMMHLCQQILQLQLKHLLGATSVGLGVGVALFIALDVLANAAASFQFPPFNTFLLGIAITVAAFAFTLTRRRLQAG